MTVLRGVIEYIPIKLSSIFKDALKIKPINQLHIFDHHIAEARAANLCCAFH